MIQVLNLSSLVDKIGDRDLEHLCRDNPDARLERDKLGNLISMSPTGSETGEKNSDLLIQIGVWNSQYKLGKVFDSSTGFKLSNGAIRSPDVSWVRLEVWNSLSKEQKRTSVTSFGGFLQRRGLKFAPIDPYFVLELMSPTDILEQVRDKMKEYMSCGVRLGWLINPDEKQVEIYRQGREKEVLNNPQTLSGENVLPELVVSLDEIFD